MSYQKRSHFTVVAFLAIAVTMIGGCESSARKNQRALAVITLRETVDYEQALRNYTAIIHNNIDSQFEALDEVVTHQEFARELQQKATEARDLAVRLQSRSPDAPLDETMVRTYVRGVIQFQDTERSNLAAVKAELQARQKEFLDSSAVKDAKLAALRRDLEKLQSPLSFEEQANELRQLVTAAIDAANKKKNDK
jgi:hypothetical protein